MAIFAVRYFYGGTTEQIQSIRPLHREWLNDLFEKGDLLASGPMLDSPEALLIFESVSHEALASLLDNDPFDIAGFISRREILGWQPVFGPFSSD
jgi:uncharacterized protein